MELAQSPSPLDLTACPPTEGEDCCPPSGPHLPPLALMAVPGGLPRSTLVRAAETVSLHIARWAEGKMERTRVYPPQIWIMMEKNSITL